MKRNAIALAVGLSVVSGAAHAENLFKYKGKTYDSETLSPKHRGLIYEFEAELFKKKEQLADEIILDEYFTAEAAKRKKTVDEVRHDALDSKEPTEAELKKFYEENKARIPYPFDQIKPDLVRFIKQQKAGEKQAALIAKIKKDGKYEPLMKEPVAPVVAINTEGFARRGSEQAKVTVVEFADYKCGHCAEASKAFKEIYKKYDKKVAFHFIDFPILGALSEKIAEGAACAREAGKYWEYNELAFEKQGELKDDSPKDLASKVKADAKKFEECMAKGQGKAVVSKGKSEGERVGVSGTPAVFINGKKLIGTPSVEALTKEIDNALKAAGV